MVSEYVEKVDPAMKGVLNEIDIGYIDKESATTLKQFEDNKNSKGQYDFFKYLSGLKKLDLPYDVQDYIDTSFLWQNIPEDFYEAMKDYNFSNITRVLENISKLLIIKEGESFQKYVEAFLNSETPGIIEKLEEQDPHEFKNSAGKLDFYQTMHAIIKNQEKFSNFYSQLERVFDMYDDLPTSCEEIYKDRCGHEDYITSLLWTLLGCFGSRCLGKVLSRPEYFEEILKVTFLSRSEKTITLGCRLLSHILPFHHSPQTLNHMWTSLTKSFPIPERAKLVPYLLRKIGKGMYCFGLKENLKIQQRWLYEAQNILLALSVNERWKNDIITNLIDLISEGKDLIINGKQLEHHHSGALFFLSNISKHADNFDQIPLELSAVTLNDSSLAKGTIKKISGTDATIYSVIEDTTITEPLSKIIGVHPNFANNFYENLTQVQNENLSKVILQLWHSLENNKILTNFKDVIGNIRILYNKLGMAGINAYTSIIDHMELTQQQTVEIMCNISNNYKDFVAPSKAAYDKVLKAVCANSRLDVKSEKVSKMTEEEAYQKLGQLNEESQIIASELLSLDVPVTRVIKCFELGIKDLEGVLCYVEPVIEEKPTEFLYHLSTQSNLKIKDLTGIAEIYQNSMSQFIIVSKSLDSSTKEILGGFETSIFHNCKEMPDMLTIVAALNAKPNSDGKLTCGLALGSVKIEVSNKSGSLVFVNTGSSVNFDKPLILRIFASATGEIIVRDENFGESFKISSASVYNGVNIGDFGIYLEEGEIAELLSFDLHIGKYEAKIDQKFDRPKMLQGGERYIKCKPKGKPTERCRLKILGFNDEEINEAMTSAADFSSRIEYTLKNFGQRDLSFSNLSLDHEVILDILLVEKDLDIPKGYKRIPVYENGEFIDFLCPGQRIAIVKKEIYKAGKIFSGFSLLEAGPEYEKIGELSLNIEGENADWSTQMFAKLILPKPGEARIRDIIYFKTTSVNSVLLPHGYKFIIDKEGKVINVAPKNEKNYYLFMAILTDDTLMDSYVIPYHLTKIDSGSFGMINKFENDNKSKSENLKEYDDKSPVELSIILHEFENARTQFAVKSLFINLAKKSEKVFIQILEEGNLRSILKILKDDLKELSSVFESIFKNPDAKNIRKKVVTEILREILSCIVGEDIGGSRILKPITIESNHPYDNNMDVDQVISIPGASSLKIIFDPQCHTESGCDPLRFYEQSSRTGELRNISGQGETIWTPFDVPGDTVHLYFHSDSSVVY